MRRVEHGKPLVKNHKKKEQQIIKTAGEIALGG